MSERPEFGELDNAALAALLFELASQLHVERARRLALEAALAQRGLLRPEQIEAAGSDAACLDAAMQAANVSIRKLLRTLAESSDPRAPLCAEAPGRPEGDG